MSIILSYLISTVTTLIVVGLTYVFVRLYLVKKYWENQGVKYIGSSLITSITSLLKKRAIWYDIIAMYNTGDESNEPFVGYCEMLSQGLILRDAEVIKNIMIKDFDHFADRRSFIPKDDPHLHKMLFLMTGEEWKQTRAKLSPAFTTGKIKRLFPLFQSSAIKLVQHIKENVDSTTGEHFQIRTGASS